MNPTEAIILAGGLGTRLRSAVPDLPKCMAPVAGKPFLHYVIAYLQQQGVSKLIFSLGYMHETVQAYLAESLQESQYTTVVEDQPLGTGGAIRLALEKCTAGTTIIVNGDTLFKADLSAMTAFHDMCGAHCTLALKLMTNFSRYGAVEIDRTYRVLNFKEKAEYLSGFINGGVYALNRRQFLEEELPSSFSFETDYLSKYLQTRRIYGYLQDRYFIDIGIPEDFERAQQEFALSSQ